MTEINGGPAFPRPGSEYTSVEHGEPATSPAQNGMSLRDYFAAHALSGLLAFQPGGEVSYQQYDAADAARLAYAVADAMLKQRSMPAG